MLRGRVVRPDRLRPKASREVEASVSKNASAQPCLARFESLWSHTTCVGFPGGRARRQTQPARTALTDCQLHWLRVHRRVVSFCIAAHYFSLTRCRPKPRSKRSAVANFALLSQVLPCKRRRHDASKDAPQARRAPPRRSKQRKNQTLRRSRRARWRRGDSHSDAQRLLDGVASMASRWTYRRDAVGERHARFVLTCGAGVLVGY